MTQRPDPRPEAARAALAEAVVRLISWADDGDKPSVSALCAEAGVSRPTFYRHFKSPDEVLAVAVQRRLTSMTEQIPTQADLACDGLPEAISSLLEEIWEERALYRGVLRPDSIFVEARLVTHNWLENVLRQAAATQATSVGETTLAFLAGGLLSVIAMLVSDDERDASDIHTIAGELLELVERVLPPDGADRA